MKKLKTLSIYISSYRIWVLTLLGIDLFFAFLIWAVCPNNFVSYIGLILLVLFLVIVIPLNISIRKYHKADIIFKNFLSDPSEVFINRNSSYSFSFLYQRIRKSFEKTTRKLK